MHVKVVKIMRINVRSVGTLVSLLFVLLVGGLLEMLGLFLFPAHWEALHDRKKPLYSVLWAALFLQTWDYYLEL